MAFTQIGFGSLATSATVNANFNNCADLTQTNPQTFQGQLVLSAGASSTTVSVSGLSSLNGALVVGQTIFTGTGSYTVGSSDRYVLIKKATPAATTINLPLASALLGRRLTIKDLAGNASTNVLTITPSGSDVIDGASTQVINTNYGLFDLMSVTGGWTITNATSGGSSGSNITGGTINSTTIGLTTPAAASFTNLTMSGAFVEGGIRAITAAGSVVMTASDDIILLNKTTPAITGVTLPSSPADGRCVQIKDAKGNASSFNTTITPASGTIDGQSNAVLASNYGSITLRAFGGNWFIL